MLISLLFLLIFWLPIVAIVVFVVWLVRRSSNRATTDTMYSRGYWEGRRRLRQEVMESLEQASTTVDRQALQQVLDASQWLPENTQYTTSTNPAEVQPTQRAVPANSTPLSAVQSVPLDYSIALLYLGAFLFITATGLFILLSGIDGFIKTLTVALVSVLFYGVGSFLNKKNVRLRSVGSAFVAIGLLLAPLIGLAAYGYWFNQQHVTIIWLVTSLLCVLLYLHALITLRQQYLGYLMVGVAVSLVESSLSSLQLPIYYISWGLMLTAMASVLVRRVVSKTSVKMIIDLPLLIAALCLVPVSLIWSIGLLSNHGTAQLITSLYLGALFYGLFGWSQPSGNWRVASWIIAQISFLVASGVWVAQLWPGHSALSIYFVSSAIFYIVLSLLPPLKRFVPNHYNGVVTISTALMLVAVVSLWPWPLLLCISALIAAITQWLQWYIAKDPALAVVAQLYILSIPALFGWMLYDLRSNAMAVIYMILGFGLMLLAYVVKHRDRTIRDILIMSYIAAAAISFIIATTSSHYIIAIILASIALLSYCAAWYHKQFSFSGFGHVLLYIAIVVLFVGQNEAVALIALCWIVLSVIIFGLHFLFLSEKWKTLFRYCSAGGLLLTAMIAPASTAYWFLGPAALLLLTGEVIFEATIQHKYGLYEWASSIVMVIIQWLLIKAGVHEFLIYSHLWALLLLTLSLLRLQRNEKNQFEGYLWSSLCVATLPFAVVLLSGASVSYGWIFIAEHVLMVVIGTAVRKASVIWWGLCATVLAVLYQLRELQFVALGVLSIFVLGVAIYMVTRHQKNLS